MGAVHRGVGGERIRRIGGRGNLLGCKIYSNKSLENVVTACRYNCHAENHTHSWHKLTEFGH